MTTTVYNPQVARKETKPAQKKFLEIEGTKKFITRCILLFWVSSTILLFLRLFLEGIGSDPRAIFVAFIYVVSTVFLLPFFGIFQNMHNTIQPGHPTFDAPALTAIFCYSILSLLIWIVMLLIVKILKTGHQLEETVKKDTPVDPTLSEKVVK